MIEYAIEGNPGTLYPSFPVYTDRDEVEAQIAAPHMTARGHTPPRLLARVDGGPWSLVEGRDPQVISTTMVCDTKAEHEARLITDGTRALGYLLEDGTELPTACLLHTGMTTMETYTIQWACPGDDDTCTGYYELRVRPVDWTTDPEATDALAESGELVEA